MITERQLKDGIGNYVMRTKLNAAIEALVYGLSLYLGMPSHQIARFSPRAVASAASIENLHYLRGT